MTSFPVPSKTFVGFRHYPPAFDRMSVRHTLREMAFRLSREPLEDTGLWQAQDNPQARKTRELLGVTFEYHMPPRPETLIGHLAPNLPWAEDHFQERVSAEPMNPAPSEAWWPFARRQNADHKVEEKFSHTYPERFWPTTLMPNGIRFRTGDLNDVVHLLWRQPQTRQAYLPVWFPEDTGANEGQRVPCSLGYHFIIRDGKLNVFYAMRSCDYVRHFRDDVYMAVRLAQWVCNWLNAIADESPTTDPVVPGLLTMTISSLHTFQADDSMLKHVVSDVL